MTTIRGGQLLTEGGWKRDDLSVDSGIITDAASATSTLIDAEDLIVSPGFIDIQINGAFGYDFTQDPTTIWQVGERLPELGVTSFLPTVVTSPGEITDLAIDVVTNRRPDSYRGARVVGLHFEGPWISPEMFGAHNRDHIVTPDPSVAERWAASGVVRMVTLAPERPGANEVTAILNSGGVLVSAGHTAADYETAHAAFGQGISMATHLFNQMTPLGHREPGVVGAALIAAGHCLLIVDGLHIADGALEVAWRLLEPDRLILVTDAMAALGLGPGTYPLGDGPITVGDNGPRTADGRLAGSVVTLAEAVRRLAAATSADLGAALRCATVNPARAVGLGDRGKLTAGNKADITLLDDDLNVVATIIGGEKVFG